MPFCLAWRMKKERERRGESQDLLRFVISHFLHLYISRYAVSLSLKTFFSSFNFIAYHYLERLLNSHF